MAFSNIFIKAGFWKKTNHPVKGDLSLDEAVALASSQQESSTIEAFQALGSSIVSEPIGLSAANVTSTIALTDGTALLVGHHLKKTTTLTGILVFLTVQGSFTADNFNGVAAYKYNGDGTSTRVAISENNGNVWKNTSNTWVKIPFTTLYTASSGIYFAGVLYNASSASTAPAIGLTPSAASTSAQIVDFTNSIRLNGALAASTFTTIDTLVVGQIGGITQRPYFAFY